MKEHDISLFWLPSCHMPSTHQPALYRSRVKYRVRKISCGERRTVPCKRSRYIYIYIQKTVNGTIILARILYLHNKITNSSVQINWIKDQQLFFVLFVVTCVSARFMLICASRAQQINVSNEAQKWTYQVFSLK